MFEEMRAVSDAHKFLRPLSALKMATVNGGKALGLEGEVGNLAPGSFADLVTVPGHPARGKVYEHLLQHRGPVPTVMVDGRWVVKPSSAASEVASRK
jgi:imidazolonepropionase-like amidohydrolase